MGEKCHFIHKLVGKCDVMMQNRRLITPPYLSFDRSEQNKKTKLNYNVITLLSQVMRLHWACVTKLLNSSFLLEEEFYLLRVFSGLHPQIYKEKIKVSVLKIHFEREKSFQNIFAKIKRSRVISPPNIILP